MMFIMQEFVGVMLILIIATSNVEIGFGQTSFDVTDYGAVGDAQTDDTQAFLDAWTDFCADQNDPIFDIPSNKTFLLQPLDFVGPCQSENSYIQISGNIVAPSTVEEWEISPHGTWIAFRNVDGLIIQGSGIIDGQGLSWWEEVRSNHINGHKNALHRPKALHFHNCNDLEMSGLTHLDSPMSHISINHCQRVTISNLQIIAPQYSPNTDGIDISASSYININDSFIGTGDDCVAINGGSSFININNILCGPGHGISVGSLGKHGEYDTVEEVHVTNCTFNGTQNGARIKTWQEGSGYAKKISFDQITLIDAKHPIIIDQHYSAFQNGEGVKVSEVTYNGFQGTSANEDAITLDCSENSICTEIVMDQINITSAVPGKQTKALCNNVVGTSDSTNPYVPCLS